MLQKLFNYATVEGMAFYFGALPLLLFFLINSWLSQTAKQSTSNVYQKLYPGPNKKILTRQLAHHSH